LILFFTWGTVFLDRMSQLYLAPYFAPEFHLSDQQIGFLASVVSITWALSALFFGALSDRFGRRPVLIPAVFIFSALSWLSGIAHSFEQLLVIRALMGVAEGPCWSVINAINEESSPPTRRGRNVGLVVSAAALVGLCAAPILTTQVASRLGWRWGFFVAGVPGILMGLLIWKFVKEPERHRGVGSLGRVNNSSFKMSLRRSTSPKLRIGRRQRPVSCSGSADLAVSFSDFCFPRCLTASGGRRFSWRSDSYRVSYRSRSTFRLSMPTFGCWPESYS
jgi:MFS family permease